MGVTENCFSISQKCPSCLQQFGECLALLSAVPHAGRVQGRVLSLELLAPPPGGPLLLLLALHDAHLLPLAWECNRQNLKIMEFFRN